MEEKRTEVQVLEARVVDLTEELANLEELQDILPKTEVERKKLLGRIPVEVEQDQLLLDIARLTAAHAVDFSSLTFGLGGVTEEGVKRITINASFSGIEKNLENFVRALEQNERQILVKSVGVQQEASGMTRFNLNLEAYYQG